MKKAILLIAAALLFCSQVKAQEMALAFNSTPTPQLSFADYSQTQVSSIYDIAMPSSSSAFDNEYANQAYSSRKLWGVLCIISGGSTMLGGAAVWLFGDVFNNVSSEMGDMPGFENDPDMQQGQNMANAVGNGVKTAGIIATVVGAGILGTGIWLVSSDGSSSSHRSGSRSGSRGKIGAGKRHKRYSENLPTMQTSQPDWTLSFNVGVGTTGLTLAF